MRDGKQRGREEGVAFRKQVLLCGVFGAVGLVLGGLGGSLLNTYLARTQHQWGK